MHPLECIARIRHHVRLVLDPVAADSGLQETCHCGWLRITQIGRLSNARSVAPPETTISQMNETECDFRSRAEKVVAKLRHNFIVGHHSPGRRRYLRERGAGSLDLEAIFK